MISNVLVTGGSRGIGRAICVRLASEGRHIIINYVSNEAAARETLSLVEAVGGTGELLRFDVGDIAETSAALKSWQEAHPDEYIDVLVNNAGLALGLDKEYEGSQEDWNIMIDTNIKGLLTMTRLIVPGMVERGSGHVINIGSVAGDAAYACGNVYCATKAAVKAITDGLRIDLADTPVRVTNIKPGLVETEFSRVRFHGDNERADNVYKGIKPLTGADIADVVYYAASAPAHVQIAEVLVLATHQASGSVIVRK